MVKAEQFDMPFVKDLPKREKSCWVKVWEAFQEFKRLTDKHGSLLPQTMAAKVAGVSAQRIDQLCNEDRIERVYFNEHPFIIEESFLAWARSERKNGRPSKLYTDAQVKGASRAAWDMSMEFAREITGRKKKS